MGLLDGKVALVTGGSRGLGESIVRVFAREGAKVMFTYVSSRERAVGIEDSLKTGGFEVMAINSDASSFVQAESVVQSTIDKYGRVDILVNNAGITRDNLILRMTESDWDQIMDTNLKSVFNLCKHIIKPMLKQRSGSIINMSSVVGVFGNAGQTNYAASKAGIIGFTKSLAKELGSRSIRCNAIAPGYIETDLTQDLNEQTREAFLAAIPLKRMGTPEDVANTCVFLGSDKSTYITGQVISVCGGLNI
ncbi:MAG TPA: 3-oxoacyl-[acyl-carrier-protein] reductase [Saprospiraceae bacterium]|nr:3-oxoacyl-[acyl-carrier-protein] reductase [Saprospiraceae bacterium]